MSKDRLEEMEELLNEYYENIDDPFASTDNAMAIVDKVSYFVKRVQELEYEVEEMTGLYNSKNSDYLKEKAMREHSWKQNKRYREVIKETLQAMGMVDRQKYGSKLEKALEEPK